MPNEIFTGIMFRPICWSWNKCIQEAGSVFSNLLLSLGICNRVDPPVPDPSYERGKISLPLGCFAILLPSNFDNNAYPCLVPLTPHQRHKLTPPHFWICYHAVMQNNSPWMPLDLHNPTSLGPNCQGNEHENVLHQL